MKPRLPVVFRATAVAALLCSGCCGSLKSAIRAYGDEAQQHGVVVTRLIEACEAQKDDPTPEQKAQREAACQQAKVSVQAWITSSKTLSEVQ
jgi:hypothetical protein